MGPLLQRCRYIELWRNESAIFRRIADVADDEEMDDKKDQKEAESLKGRNEVRSLSGQGGDTEAPTKPDQHLVIDIGTALVPQSLKIRQKKNSRVVWGGKSEVRRNQNEQKSAWQKQELGTYSQEKFARERKRRMSTLRANFEKAFQEEYSEGAVS